MFVQARPPNPRQCILRPALERYEPLHDDGAALRAPAPSPRRHALEFNELVSGRGTNHRPRGGGTTGHACLRSTHRMSSTGMLRHVSRSSATSCHGASAPKRFGCPLARFVQFVVSQHIAASVQASATRLCRRAPNRLDNFAPPHAAQMQDVFRSHAAQLPLACMPGCPRFTKLAGCGAICSTLGRR